MPLSVCPKCGAKFDPRGNRLYPGLLRDLVYGETASPESRIASASLVKCPRCGTEFSSDAIRFFGMFSPTGMRYVVIALVVLIAAFGAYIALGARR